MKNKIVIVLVVLVAVFAVLQFSGQGERFGVSFQEPSFSSATHTQISCSSANVSTSVLVAGNRNSFIATNASPRTIYLCRNSTGCSATSGIPIFSTSSLAWHPYVQVDNYNGEYICRGESATTTLDIDYNQ